MRIDFKQILNRTRGLLLKPNATWELIASEKMEVKDLRASYVLPWIVLCVALSFLAALLHSPERKFEMALLKASVNAISLLGGYFLACRLCWEFLRKKTGLTFSQAACESVVAYSFTTVFVLKMLVSLIPSLFFLQILVIHAAYLLWGGLGAVMKMSEKEREQFLLVFSLSVIVSPLLIAGLLNLMLPNA